MPKTTRLAASDISGTNKVGFDFEIKSDLGTLTTSNPNHEIQLLPSGGMVFSYDSGDLFEPFEPIVSSSLTLTFFATHDDQLTDIVSMNRGGEKSTYIKVRMWKDTPSEQFWYGVLVPESTRYEVTEGRTLVELRFADGLKMLGGIELKDYDSGELYDGGKTFLEIANIALRKIPWVESEFSNTDYIIRETPFFELKDWYDSAGYSFATDGGMLRKCTTMVEAFSEEKKKRNDGRRTRYSETIPCDEVLENICRNLGYKLCWNGETFHFFSPLNYSDDMLGQDSHPSLLYALEDVGNTAGQYDVFSPRWLADNDTKLLSGASRVFSNAYNEAAITHKSGLASNLLGAQSGIRTESSFDNLSSPAVKNIGNYSIQAGNTLTLRVASTLNQQYGGTGYNTPNRHYVYFAKVKIKVGSYYLSAPAQSNSTIDTLELIDPLLGTKTYPCMKVTLPEAVWTTTPSYVDIPMSVGFSYMTPTADEHPDGNNFIPHSVLVDSDGNFEVDNSRNLLKMDYVIVTPELPVDCVGLQFAHGLGWTQNIEGDDDGTDILYHYNQIDDAVEFTELFNTDEVVGYFNQSAFLYEGSQISDPVYSTQNSEDSFIEVIDLGDVLVAPRLNRNGSLGFVGYERESDGEIVWGSTFTTEDDRLTVEPNGLKVLTNEWYRFAGAGMEGLEAELVFNHDSDQVFVPWADSVLATGCVLGGGLVGEFLISSMEYDLSGGLRVAALLIDRDKDIVLVDNDTLQDSGIQPVSPTKDGRVNGGGGGITEGELDDANDTNQILSYFLTKII